MMLKQFTTMLGLALAGTAAAHAASATDHTVALVLGVNGSPFYEALACGASDEAKKLGLTLHLSAASQFAADQQIPVVDAVTASHPAVAVIVPTDSEALVAPMRALAKSGTAVVTADQTLGDTSFLKSQIETDNSNGGKLAADEMNRLLGGKGSVLVITQPPGSTAQDERTSGFETELKTFAGIHYLGAQYQSDDPQKAAEIVTSTLSAHPDLAGIFSTNDQGAIGAITGLRQAGAGKRIKLIAYDAATPEVDALKNGTIAALIAQNPKQEGEVAMDVAEKLIAGQAVAATVYSKIAVIHAGETAKAETYEYKADCSL
jgi:ribose transport system substrate-binding protein